MTANAYKLFFLTPGQIPPAGTTSIELSNGGIMWYGNENAFPDTSITGIILDNDKTPNSTYNYRDATADEITEYKTILAEMES